MLKESNKNKYTGKFKGNNVIFLQLEGIDKWLLRTSYHGGFAYIGMNDGTHFEPTMEQSTCSFACISHSSLFLIL